MNFPKLFITLVVLSGIVVACSKRSQEAVHVRAKVYNLGEVEVSDGLTTRHDLGGGRICVITPAFQKDGSILLGMSIEQGPKVIARPRVQASPNVSFEITDGDVGIAMTPRMVK